MPSFWKNLVKGEILEENPTG